MVNRSHLLVGVIWVTSSLQFTPVLAQTTSSLSNPAVTTTAPLTKTAGTGLAVIEAALKGDLKTLSTLLGRGSDPDEVNAKGRTALHVAAFFGNMRTARLLLAAGADANLVDSRQITPLILAATNGHLEMVKLLLAQGADATLQDKIGRTAQTAASRGGFKAVEEAIKKAALAATQKKTG